MVEFHKGKKMKMLVKLMLLITIIFQILGCTMNFAPFSEIDANVDKHRSSETEIGNIQKGKSNE